MQILVDLAVKYALSWLGTPYKWGGDDFSGWDCSGLVQEILASVGADPDGDQTAESLYAHFVREGQLGRTGPGALVFFGSRDKIVHVGFCVSDWHMIEAGGGGQHVLTNDDARTANAFVRLRPIRSRRDFVAIIMPRYQLS